MSYIHHYQFEDGTTIEIYGRGFTAKELDMMIVTHGRIDHEEIICVEVKAHGA